MEFFKLIAEHLQDGQQITLVIKKSGQNLVTSVLPDTKGVKDAAVKNIPPLTMSGTPEDYEEGFAASLKPLDKAIGLLTELSDYEAEVEEARKKSAIAEAEKKESDKRKKQFNDLLNLARKNKDEHKFKDARAILAKAAAIEGSDKKAVDAIEKEIVKLSGEGSLFGGLEDKSDGKDVADGKAECESEECEDSDGGTDNEGEE
ncbi:MAG: PRTRC system protein E [Prevotella sp.]|nr:PRTRC system protein E [Prevotella sp.]